jgi:hypothetical protein
MDPNHPEQQNNARKIVDMGAGIAIDGRTVTREVLERSIAMAIALIPKPFCHNHACIDGRKNAFAVITQACRSTTRPSRDVQRTNPAAFLPYD